LSVRNRQRPGFTLLELMVTVAIIGGLVLVAAASLRTNDTQKTREAGFDIIELMRRARYFAARQNTAVVVRVVPFGGTDPDGNTTRGFLAAFEGPDTACPATIPLDATPLTTLDFGIANGDPAPGLAVLAPETLAWDGVGSGFCIRPNGRILDNETGQPIPATGGSDMAGKAQLFVQWDPVREQGGQLVVPFVEVEVPFNGLVRIPQ
jgi:prepilin-type N-terminal cleavage/methylation domain-containing protein